MRIKNVPGNHERKQAGKTKNTCSEVAVFVTFQHGPKSVGYFSYCCLRTYSPILVNEGKTYLLHNIAIRESD
jgi:hypothetical protein